MHNSNKEIKSIYLELKGVLHSLKDITSGSSWFDDNGFAIQVNDIVKRIPLCTEINDVQPYLINVEYLEGRKTNIVNIIPTRTKISTIIGRLDGLYGLEDEVKQNGLTFIQNQHQSQNQTISIVLNLQEKILSEMPKYLEGTKERSFLEKLKDKLPSVTDSLSIFSSILTIANETGLSIDAIQKLLGL
ncbi:MAG: hypothetical protein V4576_01745 [Patescibacteria group bacterium]